MEYLQSRSAEDSLYGGVSAKGETDRPEIVRRPLVVEATENLKLQISLLEEAVNELAIRLEPVSRHESPCDPSKKEQIRQSVCPLADALFDLNDRIMGLRMQIVHHTGLIEI